MSFAKSQMVLTVDGIRSGVEVVGSNPEWASRSHHEPTGQEYGNTKWTDFIIADKYIRNAFDMKKASIDIGYSKWIKTTYKNGSKGRYLRNNERALRFRLRRINSNGLLNVIQVLLISETLTKEIFPKIMNKTSLTEKKTVRAVKNYEFHRFYAKSFAVSALKEFHNKEDAAEALWISVETLNYWLNTKVKDIRVTGRDWRKE